MALRRMSKLVNYLMSRHDSGPFREPVDWKGLDLYDYPKIIKKMMDLGTVKRKLERGQYGNAKECAQDIRLIWTNCKTYNADGSDFYLLAESFSKRFEDRYKKVQAEFDTGDNEKKKSSYSQKTGISLDAKTKFASNIFRLSGMEIGHVLQVIDLKCPQALEQPDPSMEMPRGAFLDDSEVEINVDAIDPRTFAELDRYVKEKMHARTSGEALSEFEGTPKKQKR
eukprot:CAMPEP_0197239400 /NCGR_PEP_ID=MMETSP1429-20130617/5877_1 /TAXON_ID=49237 /ORGANISM="Chaetoceros  sp., Strain UNC1202" /LENGTH=224 /DNA_ID=CAMNT_0042698813 /DNA_START=119 /DNA_END=793 /DNA_ORIENTATION=-